MIDRTEWYESTGAACALAALDGIKRSELGAVLAHHGAIDAIRVVLGELPPDRVLVPLLDDHRLAAWRAALARRPPEQWAAENDALGVRAVTVGDDDYPWMLHNDPRSPEVLFVRGDLDVLDARRVGIVGTRNATRHGRETAVQLGHDLSASGVCVVSGLAKGIDAAAHIGALRTPGARPVGVVGNGLDRPYPASNRELWHTVAERGLLVSEWPLGAAPEAYHFPLRNRIIAAFSEVVVVVESRETGGSLITAVEAAERGVPVMAVPGSLHNRAANGTNRLIADGAAPVTGADDVLVALGLDTRRCRPSAFDPRPAPRGLEAQVLERCRRDPATLDELVVEMQVPIGEVAMAVARLERAGWVRGATGWFEAVDTWPDLV
jgi:DNA processing protein